MAGGRSRQNNRSTEVVTASRNVNWLGPNTASWSIKPEGRVFGTSVSRDRARTIVGDTAVRRMEQQVSRPGGPRQESSSRGMTYMGWPSEYGHGKGSVHGVSPASAARVTRANKKK